MSYLTLNSHIIANLKRLHFQGRISRVNHLSNPENKCSLVDNVRNHGNSQTKTGHRGLRSGTNYIRAGISSIYQVPARARRLTSGKH